VLLKQAHYRIPKAKLSTFLALVQASVVLLLKADNLSTPKELNKLAAQLATALSLAIKTVEKLDQGASLAAPW
jgi:predicted regulator of Ras-like GTPase activity (Roadblock/LC7/MglB family)